MPPPEPGTTPASEEVKLFAVTVIVPDVVTGEPETLSAAFAEDTETDVTVPEPPEPPT